MGFSAVNTGNNLLFLVVSGLLAFMSATGLAGMLNLQKLVPELIAPPEVFAGNQALFRIRLHNRKPLFPSFLISLKCPDGVHVTMPVVPSGKQLEAGMGMIFQERGRATAASITVSSTFPVAFFTRYWTIPLDTEFIVFPKLVAGKIDGSGDDQKRFGQNVHHLKGTDGELERIAAYSGREPLRMIHWKHTARNDELVVKEFGGQAAEPLVIDLDEMPEAGLEERISRAAWLVRYLENRRPIGLRLGEGHLIPPGSGHRHGLRLLTELALYGKN